MPMAFDSRSVRIAPASPDLNRIGPDLIYDTDPPLFDYIFSGDRTALFDVLRDQVADTRGMFSYRHAHAANLDGQIVGMEIGWPASARAALTDETFLLFAEYLDGETLETAASRAPETGYFAPELGEDAYYVVTLSVVPDARNRGIGERLLETAVARARGMGARAVELDVRGDSDAVRFYERFGMTRRIETRLPHLEAAHGIAPHFRMVLAL